MGHNQTILKNKLNGCATTENKNAHMIENALLKILYIK